MVNIYIYIKYIFSLYNVRKHWDVVVCPYSGITLDAKVCFSLLKTKLKSLACCQAKYFQNITSNRFKSRVFGGLTDHACTIPFVEKVEL